MTDEEYKLIHPLTCLAFFREKSLSSLFFFLSQNLFPSVCTQRYLTKYWGDSLKYVFEQRATTQRVLRWRRHFINQILRASDGRTMKFISEFLFVFFLLVKLRLIFATIKTTVCLGIIWGLHYNCRKCCGFWHSENRASWYILIIKPTRCTNFPSLFLE
jgi:hypothetical protein